MDRVFEAAVNRLDELKQEIKKLEEFVSTYRQLAVELHIESQNIMGTKAPSTAETTPVDNVLQKATIETQTPDAAPPVRVRVRGNPKPNDVVAAAVEVIRIVGRPMTRREIHEALKERGMEVRGGDPIKTLGTMLWRSGQDELVQLEGLGYWDRTQPYYQANYDPDPIFDMSKKASNPDLLSDDYA